MAEIINNLAYIEFAYPLVDNLRTRRLPAVTEGETKITDAGQVAMVSPPKKAKTVVYDKNIKETKTGTTHDERSGKIKDHSIKNEKSKAKEQVTAAKSQKTEEPIIKIQYLKLDYQVFR